MTARFELPAERIGLCGLLRLVPASDAPAARREAREDFAVRFRAMMGYECPAEDLERWWPE